MAKSLTAVPLSSVIVRDGFWSALQNLVIDVMLPYQADILEDKVSGDVKSHAIANFRIAAGETCGEFGGMVFQDSDVAKWLEAAAYALTVKPNPALEQKADGYIGLIGRAQEADGYLNTYFTIKEPTRKWQNLQECHELYCAGHMIEAAVAYYEATCKDSLLKIARKNADLICRRFGKGKTRGVPGHQEIELALLRLYSVTKERTYLETAGYFLDERGREPDFFTEEKAARGWTHFNMNPENREYAQNHLPAKQQDRAVGHSVRAAYMYSAMAALAGETGDAEWAAACRAVWDNITGKQMYITGGIGQTVAGEAFSVDYDLPNDTAYAETCASVGMVFFARYMLETEPNGKYADIMEKELYNGVLGGMQLDGKSFFYVNPLEVVPGISGEIHGHKHVKPSRREWYGCACCPPNLARLITSLGLYAWGEGCSTVYNHLYIAGSAKFKCAGGLRVDCETDYPWEGNTTYTIHPETEGAAFSFAVRVPAWCGEWSLTLNGDAVKTEPKDGYAYIRREWSRGNKVKLSLDIVPKRMYTNVRVRDNTGCVALQRGPIVYCFEEADNGADLAALRLPREVPIAAKKQRVESIGDVVVLEAVGFRLEPNEALYSDTPPERRSAKLCAVPYYAWGNRKSGGMRVWLQEG